MCVSVNIVRCIYMSLCIGGNNCRDFMFLMHTLFFQAAKGEYHVSIAHIPGGHNCIADHLSRLYNICRPSGWQHPWPTH